MTRDCKPGRRDRIFGPKQTLDFKRGEHQLNVKVIAKCNARNDLVSFLICHRLFRLFKTVNHTITLLFVLEKLLFLFDDHPAKACLKSYVNHCHLSAGTHKFKECRSEINTEKTLNAFCRVNQAGRTQNYRPACRSQLYINLRKRKRRLPLVVNSTHNYLQQNTDGTIFFFFLRVSMFSIFLRFIFQNPRKNFKQKNSRRNFLHKTFTSVAEPYVQTSPVPESCGCCQLFKLSLLLKTKRWNEKQIVQKYNNGLQERIVRRFSNEKSIYNSAQEHDVIVIEEHWLLDYCVLLLYMLLHLSIACILIKNCINVVISIKGDFPKIVTNSKQQE